MSYHNHNMGFPNRWPLADDGISDVSYWRNKTIVLLGGKCVRCDEDDIEILNIDHRYSNGSIERRKYSAGRIYRMICIGLQSNNVELYEAIHDYYQILCVNHNWKKKILLNEDGRDTIVDFTGRLAMNRLWNLYNLLIKGSE